MILPKKLFLLDGLGALFSFVILCIIMLKFQNLIGLPKVSLYILACIPLGFLCFDFYSFRLTNMNKMAKHLQIISAMNLGYCLLSLSVLGYYWEQLTRVGMTYFFLEIAIIIILAYIEWATSKRIVNGQ